MADEPLTNDDIEELQDEKLPEKADKAPARKERRQRRRQQSWSSPDTDQSAGEYKRPVTRFRPRRKVCTFCADKVKVIDWKDVETFRRFVGSNGSIRARRKTGTCAKHQRQLAVAIKRARHLALMPFTDEHLRLAGKS
jgi:small subunit ribosomal protein S18